MAQMTTPEELFEHELKDMYYAEKLLTQMLPTLAREATSRDLTRAFEQHLKETNKQVENLERVFAEIGKSAQGEPCPGMEGIKREHDKFMQEEQATDTVRDMFLTGAAARTEHYEIAAYTGLVAKARSLGQTKAAKLLDENLRQEKDALKKVESISKELLKTTKNGRSRSSSGSSRSGSTSGSRSGSTRSGSSRSGGTRRSSSTRRTTGTRRS